MRESASSGLIVMPHALTRRPRDAQLEIFVPELGTKSAPMGLAHLQNSIRVYDPARNWLSAHYRQFP
jgi:hypothetical protein